jgi:hypothetical protein
MLLLVESLNVFLGKHNGQQARVLIPHHTDEQTGNGPAALSDAKRLGI